MRYQSQWPLPSYKFIPGVNPHPMKADGHMEKVGEPIANPIDLSSPEKNEFLRFALDLYNHEYFWESHVYAEALWNAHERTGPVADFLKAFIKLGAAGVKLSLEQRSAASGHFERALELFTSVKKEVGTKFLGFDLDQIIEKLKNEASNFPLHPSWK